MFRTAGLIGLMLSPCRPCAAGVIFRGDYESGSRAGFSQEIQGSGEYEIVTGPEPVRAGKYSCRFTLRKSQRVELVPRRCTAPVGSERWYGFSIYIPNDWVDNRRKDEVVAQWHATPDRDKGEPWRSPPLAVRTFSNIWRISCLWDSKPLSIPRIEGGAPIWKGPIEKGQWTDWVFHIKWSYRDDGLVEVWKNGTFLNRRQGPNCYNDKRGLYFKWGIYHTRENRVLYNDELRIGDERTGYRTVAPPGSRLPLALSRARRPKRSPKGSGPDIWQIIAKMSKAKASAGQDPLAEFAEPIEEARKRAREGDEDGAARAVEDLIKGAKKEATKEALARMARGFRASSQLRNWIIEGVVAGRHEATFATLLGKPMRGRAIGADESGLTLLVAGAEFPVAWGAMKPERLAALAGKYASGDGRGLSPEAAAALEDFYMAFGLATEK